MSLAQSPIDRRASPSFAPTNPFASNNPFRNRVSASSPDLPSPSIRQSRNPFLDVFGDDDQDLFRAEGDSRSSNKPQTASETPAKPEPENLLINLSIDDEKTEKQSSRKPSPAGNGDRDPRSRGTQQRALNGPPRPGRVPPPPPKNQKGITESSGARALISPNLVGKSSRGREEGKSGTRQRSNSESSAMGVVDREREKEKERERRREKSKRDSDDKNKDDKAKKAAERRKKGAPLDIIDKLDVTGIYGGGLFHHDGPFDACNPHRNKNKTRAPMQAFPEGSKNNVLGGFDFDLKSNDHSQLFGNRDPEAYSDFAAGRRGSAAEVVYDPARPNSKRTQSFDPINRPIVHGEQSLGLGTSTFLEGAPAAKRAIEKAQAEEEVLRPVTSGGYKDGGGLQRKKSLAQKFRGLGAPKQNFNEGADRIAPGFDRRHKPTKSASPTFDTYPERPSTPSSPRNGPPLVNRSTKAQVSQGWEGATDDYDSAWERKGESIQIAEEERRTRDRAPSSPKKPMIGRTISEGSRGYPSANGGSDQAQGGSGGLLKRVKSMSKGKRRDAS